MSASPNEDPVILWPCWGLPFRKTLRGDLCRAYTTRPFVSFYFAAFSILLPLTLVPYIGGELEDLRVVFAVLLVIVVPLGLVHYWFWLRPVIPVVRAARRHSTTWRKNWLQFVADARAHNDELLREVESGEFMEDAWAKCPVIPPLQNIITSLQTTMQVEAALVPSSESWVVVEHKLSTFVRKLVQSTTGSTVLVGSIPSSHSVVAMVLIHPTLVVYAIADYSIYGQRIVPRLSIGHWSWHNAQRLIDGRWFRGDLARLRTSWSWPIDLLVYVVPIINLWAAAVAIKTQLMARWRTDLATQLEHRLRPYCGDSADVGIIQESAPNRVAREWPTTEVAGGAERDRVKALWHSVVR